MKIRQFMHKELRTCPPDASLADAAQVMWDHDVGFVPIVTSDGQLEGLITDRDICMAACLRGGPLEKLTIRDTCSREAVRVRDDAPLHRALELMKKHQLRRLPVVDSDHRLVGVVTIHDLARLADASGPVTGAQIAETLAAIAAPRRAPQLSA